MENTIALSKDGGYIGLKAMNGLKMVKDGPCTYREFVSPGRMNIWVLKVKSCQEENDTDSFLEEIRAIGIEKDETGVTVKDGETEFRIGYDMTFLVNGKDKYDYPLGTGGKITLERN